MCVCVRLILHLFLLFNAPLHPIGWQRGHLICVRSLPGALCLKKLNYIEHISVPLLSSMFPSLTSFPCISVCPSENGSREEIWFRKIACFAFDHHLKWHLFLRPAASAGSAVSQMLDLCGDFSGFVFAHIHLIQIQIHQEHTHLLACSSFKHLHIYCIKNLYYIIYFALITWIIINVINNLPGPKLTLALHCLETMFTH